MSYIMFFKAAIRADGLAHDAELALQENSSAREQNLGAALNFVRKVEDATKIYRLSKDDSMRAAAKRKAITLLNASPKAVKDFILIDNCRFYFGPKDSALKEELAFKRELILKDPSIQQLCQILSESDAEWLFRWAEHAVYKFVESTNDIEFLDRLSEIVLTDEFRTRANLHWPTILKRARERLASDE